MRALRYPLTLARLTERLRTGRVELEESEARFRALFEQAAVGMAQLGPDGRVLRVNPALCAIVGLPESAVASWPTDALFGSLHEWPSGGERVTDAADPAAAVSSVREVCRADGSSAWVHVTLSRLVSPSGELHSIVAIVMDVTRRVQAEERTRESRAFLEAVLECTASAIVACDAERVLTLFNRSARNVHGLDAQPLSSDAWAETYSLRDASGAALLRGDEVPLARAFRGEHVHDFEMVVGAPGQPERVVVTNAAPVLDSNGVQVGAVASMTDVTEKKRSEEALLASHASLEARVAERTSELTAANERLAELDRLKSLFIASMSHELRTPLNSVIGFTGLLLMEVDGELNASQRDYLGRVQSAGRHLLALVSDVIDVSTIEAGRVEAYVQQVELNALVNEAAASVSVDAGAKGLALHVRTPAAPTWASTDRKRVLQCVLNLLSNAVKYSQKGDVVVRLEADDARVRIAVEDTGIGIAAEDMPRLFQQFSRIDSPASRTARGTGLGLYLTRMLVSSVLHGRVGARSELGVGSTFWFDFPRGASDEAHPGDRGRGQQPASDPPNPADRGLRGRGGADG